MTYACALTRQRIFHLPYLLPQMSQIGFNYKGNTVRLPFNYKADSAINVYSTRTRHVCIEVLAGKRVLTHLHHHLPVPCQTWPLLHRGTSDHSPSESGYHSHTCEVNAHERHINS